MLRQCVLLCSVVTYSMTALAQGPVEQGRWFASWGWNRSSYSTSDIHLTGQGHDLTLYDVRATDRPTPVSLDYMNPLQLTIPQTDLQIGWFFRDHYSIALGFDHMKYVVVEDQVVRVSGHIDDSDAYAQSTFANEEVTLRRDFLMYEHSDGLNFMHLELARHDRIAALPALRLDITLTEGIDAGVLVPRTACRFLGKPLNDEYHLSGYGTAVKAGLCFTFFNCFFLGAELKGGFINLPDVRTSTVTSDRASQHFWFTEGIVLFGATFRLRPVPDAERP